MTNPLPKVFITGASGYIGFEVAQAYSRAGHTVYGLVRTEEKAKLIAAQEIFPVVGDVTDTNGKWVDVLKESDIIIHCAADYTQLKKVDDSIIKTVLSVLSSVRTPANPARFVYTSGIQVYKGIEWPQDEPITDDSPLDGSGSDILAGRIESEKSVLRAYEETNGTVAGFVLRPSVVYGKKSQYYYTYFEQALKGDVVIQGDPNMYKSSIHIDDLCEGYIKLTSHPYEEIHSQAFVFCTPAEPAYLFSVQQIAERFSRVAGYTGPIRHEPVPESNRPYLKTVVCNPVKAQTIFGWAPRHPPLLDQIEVLFSSWKASNNISN